MKFSQQHADVAIVGGGIVGGAAALSLAKRGFSVLLLERDYRRPLRARRLRLARSFASALASMRW